MLKTRIGYKVWKKAEKSNILLPLLLGSISALSFIFSSPILLILGNALLILLLQNKTFKVADRIGLSYGLSYYFVGLYWFFEVDDNYEATSHFVLIGFEVLAILLMSLPFALLCVFLTIFPKKTRYSIFWFVGIVAPSFTFLEWAKTWYFSGFPWFQASHVLSTNFFNGWYATLGELGVSFIFYVFVSLCVFAFLNVSKVKTKLFVLSIFILFTLTTWLLGKISYTRDYKSPILVQVYSDGIGSTKKNNANDRVKSIESFQSLTLSKKGLDLSVWPESASGIGAYSEISSRLIAGFQKLSDKNVEVLFGGYSQKGAQYQNSLFSGSSQKEVYTKQHLVPVGEYIPEWFSILDFWIPGSFQSSTVSDSTLGSSTHIRGLNLAPMICYEIMFGEEVRKRAVNSNLLISIGNLLALKPHWVKRYFWNLAKIRSFELQIPLVQSNSFGYSGFISSAGKTESFYYADFRDSRVSSIQAVVGQTPYSRYGYSLILIVCSILVSFGVFGVFLKSRRRIRLM